MVLREHYEERRRAVISISRTVPDRSPNEPSPSAESGKGSPKESQQIAHVRVEDDWALQYLTLSRVQPLLEALDDDVSSLVTITELNDFVDARPKDWGYVCVAASIC